MADALESRVTALEAKLKDIEEQPVSGSVEFRLSRQIKRLDHKFDIVGADVSELINSTSSTLQAALDHARGAHYVDGSIR
jgi:hypothetical protein